MIQRINVPLDIRAMLYLNERPVRFLGPGKHWVVQPFLRGRVVKTPVDSRIANFRAEELELVPRDQLRVLTLGPFERAVLTHRGRPIKWLGTGEHQVWTVDRTRIDLVDVSGTETSPLTDEVKALVPSGEYVEALVPQGSVAIRWVDGGLDRVLGPGRYAAWSVRRRVTFAVLDLRERLLHVTGQEVMTRDRVSLRLNLTAAFKVVDPTRLATVAREAEEMLYLAMQMAAREAISARTLDQLLQERELLSLAIGSEVQGRAAAVGLEVVRFGLKDIVLPGEMKQLLNRVIEAQKEAEANVILRREETAAARSLRETAKVLAESPLLIRLKELEAYKELAAKVGQVHLVLGEGALPTLQIKS